MSQSSTLFIGMEVHQETMAGAYVAQEHGAEVTAVGTTRTRQCDSAPLVRQRPAKATHLLCVYEAGPWGDWLLSVSDEKRIRLRGRGPRTDAPKSGRSRHNRPQRRHTTGSPGPL